MCMILNQFSSLIFPPKWSLTYEMVYKLSPTSTVADKKQTIIISYNTISYFFSVTVFKIDLHK